LREIVTRVFEVDKNQIRIYEGDYDYYLRKKKQEAGM
jgi:ATP-binding cassette subfamily F protein 3